MRKDYLCPHCESRDITWDATAGWDAERQAHDLSGILQNCDCNACGETGISPREVEPAASDAPPSDPDGDAALREQARALYEDESCDIEIDKDARVSRGDGGAFVAAWVWVPFDAGAED